MLIGYIRTSTAEQNSIRQEVLMNELGVEQVYIDRMKMYEFEAKIKDVETQLESKLHEWEEIMVMLDN